jgi:hypothetical protein
MPEPARRPLATLGARGVVHRLESWKEIAAYLGPAPYPMRRTCAHVRPLDENSDFEPVEP